MLDLERHARGDSEMERALAPLAAEKAQLLRYGTLGECLADDGRPLRDELRLGEAALAEHRAGNLRHLGGKRAHPAAPFRRHGFRSWQGIGGRGMVGAFRPAVMPRALRPKIAADIALAVAPEALAQALLAWYDRHRRELPWRARRGERADPYRVWLSEIMLQQTTVATVAPHFQRFLARWPDLAALAAASLDDVLHAWQGLGYYARARHLHACARIVAEGHGGRFPERESELRELPGVGDYTAAAVAAIAFDQRATPVDGNVERVMARLFAHDAPLPGAKPALRRLAATLTPASRAGDYAQAVMDLGATICTPQKPKCILCPWREACRARALGIAPSLPARARKGPKPLKRGVAFWALRADGAVLLRRRPENGLLGGMMEVPSTPWRATPWTVEEARRAAPVAAKWRLAPGLVRHGFTHFDLELTVLAGEVRSESPQAEGKWVALDNLDSQALPTLMKKIVAHARDSKKNTRARKQSGVSRAGR
jgi:A/G-specific adenine glycosylase